MSSSESGKKHRRPHRKSRLGCQQCKKRKIKCDEAWSSCLNCIRREVDCSFALESVNAETSSGTCCCHCTTCHSSGNQSSYDSTEHQRSQNGSCGVPAELQNLLEQQSLKLEIMSQRLMSMECAMTQLYPLGPFQASLSYADAGLLHHYFTQTVATMAEDKGREFWHVRLPDISAQNPHVLHFILAFAALHKCRVHPQQRSELLALAEQHQTIGIRGTTTYLENISNDNDEMVYTSAILIGLINLAIGPRPGEYIAFSDNGKPGFMSLIRGVQSIKHHREQVSAPEEVPSHSWSFTGQGLSALDFEDDCHYGQHLLRLHKLIENIPEVGLRKAYVAAVDDLEQFFVRMEGPDPARPNMSPQPDAAHHMSPLGWLYRVPERFLEGIQRKEPLSLVILASFVVVLKNLEKGWPADGWAEHMMSGIWSYTHPEFRPLIQWPMKRLAWQPVEGFLSTTLALTPS